MNKKSMSICFFLIFILSIISGCSKSNPQKNEDKGFIVITSNPEDARIVIDNIDKGKITPDSLEIDKGLHILKVFLIGYITDSISFSIAEKERKSFHFDLIREERNGIVYVNSFTQGAQILLDYQNVSITPDTIIVSVGSHNLNVSMDNFISPTPVQFDIVEGESLDFNFTLLPQKFALIEEFSNINCQACVTTGRFVHNISNSSNRILLISYHTRFPNPMDPFYTANQTDNQTRADYYSVTSAPDVYVGGTKAIDPTDSSLISQMVQTELSNGARAGFTGTLTLETNSVRANIKVFGFGNISGELYSALIQKYVHYEISPGTNGEKDFYNSMRQLEYIAPISTSMQSVNEYQVTMNWDNVNLDDYEVIVFIQNTSEKRIIESASIR